MVLDLELGSWSGRDLLRILRRQYDLPVLMLSGRDDEDMANECLDLGAKEFLHKPIHLGDLVSRIRFYTGP